MTIFSEGFDAASVDVGTTLVTITSTEEEKKTALRVKITDVSTQPLLLTVEHEREKIVKDIPLEVAADKAPVLVIDVELAIPAGEKVTFSIKPQTAGSQGTLVGWVEYEIEGK